jgi:outer membrane protein assembly factor BamB
MTKTKLIRGAALGALCVVGATTAALRADDWPQWGRTNDRNMVSTEKGAPTDWDVGDPAKPGDGKNIKWEAQLGSQSYGNPTVANGIVWVGTNNEARYDPRFQKDGGVLLAFRESDGKFLWQNYRPKLEAGRVNDWPYQGNCSSASVIGGRLYYTTNRCEVLCYDVSPLLAGERPKPVWSVDMMKELNVFPHNMTASSVVAHGDLVYVITGNGVDDAHRNVPSPDAPAIVAFNKNTGKVVWQKNPVGDRILHGQWASAAVADVNGRAQVIAPLGDGWVYSFDADTGELIWKFDSNPKESLYFPGGSGGRNELIATPVVHDNRMYIANGQDPEHGEGTGRLWCVDITKTGDISKELATEEPAAAAAAAAPAGGELLGPASIAKPRKGKPNPNSGVVWEFESLDANKDGKIKREERMNRSISTVSVTPEGLVFAPDFSGFLHCLDAKTGQLYWTHDMEAAMWGSPLYADGKIYLGDEDGDVAIFKASKDKSAAEPIAEHNMGSSVYGSPVFANGTLYILSNNRLFAIGGGGGGGGNAPQK